MGRGDLSFRTNYLRGRSQVVCGSVSSVALRSGFLDLSLMERPFPRSAAGGGTDHLLRVWRRFCCASNRLSRSSAAAPHRMAERLKLFIRNVELFLQCWTSLAGDPPGPSPAPPPLSRSIQRKSVRPFPRSATTQSCPRLRGLPARLPAGRSRPLLTSVLAQSAKNFFDLSVPNCVVTGIDRKRKLDHHAHGISLRGLLRTATVFKATP
jgi:hypothetical protein